MSSNRHISITYCRKFRNLSIAHQDGPSGIRRSLSGPVSDPEPSTTRPKHSSSTQGVTGLAGSTLSPSCTMPSTTSEKLGSRTLLQTPLPTQAAESEIFKLSTSKPVPDPPGYQFSPVPPTRPDVPIFAAISGENVSKLGGKLINARTSSRTQKENVPPKPRGKQRIWKPEAHISTLEPEKSTRLALASPFTSRPSSPLGTTSVDVDRPRDGQLQTSRTSHRPSLSDISPNVNGALRLQAAELSLSEAFPGAAGRYNGHHQTISQSARTSPARNDRNIPALPLASHQRRPSAPSSRPPLAFFDFTSSVSSQIQTNNTNPTQDTDITLEPENNTFMMHLASYFDFSGGDSGTYFTSSLGGTVDFNRPPSQMSTYAAEVDSDHIGTDFFTHIRGRSTPYRIHKRTSRPFDSPSVTLDLDDEGETESSKWGGPLPKMYSPWVSDSIISPPSYHIRQKGENDLNLSAMEDMLDMELTRPLSPQVGMARVPIPPRGTMDTAIVGSPTRVKELRTKPTLPRLQTTGLPLARTASTSDSVQVISGGEGEEKGSLAKVQSVRKISGTARARSGTIIQGSKVDGRVAGKRNRSGTIVPGGGGAMRTRSGTVVQANRIERTQPSGTGEDGPKDSGEFQDETCSCRSSDDELMLRSHSHYDLGTENLEWKVADPPSPMARRLRRTKRRYELSAKRKNRGKNRRSGRLLSGTVDEAQEDGIEGDIDDDELDLLGTFLPGDW